MGEVPSKILSSSEAHVCREVMGTNVVAELCPILLMIRLWVLYFSGERHPNTTSTHGRRGRANVEAILVSYSSLVPEKRRVLKKSVVCVVEERSFLFVDCWMRCRH